MSGLFRIGFEVRGPIHLLARAIDVMARLDLTPEAMTIERVDGGLRIQARITAPEALARLCVARLANQIGLEVVAFEGVHPEDLA